jgi:hypothetical protein
MNFKNLIILSLMLLIGCAHSEPKITKLFSLRIQIEPAQNKNTWRITYTPSYPVNNLVFDRQLNRFRSKKWRSLMTDVSLIEEAGQEKIVSRSTPLQKFVFEFDSYFEDTPKDYEFFQAFSDKSVVMYTGHLNACPLNIACEQPVEFLISSRTNEHGIVAGKVFTEQIRWRDEARRGTYVYFGQLHALETSTMTAIVDPATPAWLRQQLDPLLLKLFIFYEKRTGQNLRFKPFIFLNYSPEGEGNNHHGGTLPGLIQLSLSGKGWAKKDPEAFIDLARFLAHEAAHVWNGQMFPYASGDMWMHEGGADAFAYRALYALNIISKERFFDYQTEALNACLSLVKNRPLIEVNEDRNFTAFYKCGSVFGLLTEASVRKGNSKNDLFTFWKELFAESTKSGQEYTEDMYFSVLNRLSSSSAAGIAIKNLVRGNEVNAKNEFLKIFKDMKIYYSEKNNRLPRPYNLRISREMVRSLMKKDCKDNYGQSEAADGITTEAFEECTVFTKPLYITHLAGYKVVSSGARAYDKIKAKCENSNYKIEIRAKNEKFPLFASCPSIIPSRETFIRILDGSEL